MPGGPYTRHQSDWKDYPDVTTPVGAAFLDALELWLDGHAATATTGSHPASAVTLLDTANYFTAANVEEALAEHVAAADPHTGYVRESLIDAKGDLLTATAADTPARVAVGTNGYVLTADSAEATGVKWAVGGSNPVGVVSPYAGSSAPAGWLMCDGATASTATYPDLYALIGATYGATGAGFFTLPDLRGRVAVGRGTHTEVDALGENDGVSVANRRPKHRHTGHTHTVPTQSTFSNSGSAALYANSIQGEDGPSNYNQTTSSVDGGSGNVNDSLDAPAYIVLNYIIKT